MESRLLFSLFAISFLTSLSIVFVHLQQTERSLEKFKTKRLSRAIDFSHVDMNINLSAQDLSDGRSKVRFRDFLSCLDWNVVAFRMIIAMSPL